MKKKILLIAIFILLLFPRVIYGQMELQAEQSGQMTLLKLESEYKQKEGTVKVYDEHRLYYINQLRTDNQGRFQVEVQLPADKTYKAQINIRGEIKEITFPQGENETPPPADSKHVALVIKGFGETILLDKTIEINEGDSVLDVLRRACQENDIQLHYENTGYVISIGGLSQGDGGPLSGWKYNIGNTTPGISSSNYLLEGGESVLWYFVKTPANTSTDTGFIRESLLEGGQISYNDKNEGQITFTMTENEDKPMSFSFPKEMVPEIEKNEIKWVYIDMGVVQIRIPAEEIKNMEAIHPSGTVELTLKKIGREDLPDNKSGFLPEGLEGYSFSLTNGDIPVKSFKYPIEIEIPFPRNVGNEDHVTVFYWDGESLAAEIIGGKYNPQSQTVRFMTNHFSLFFAGEHQVSFQDVDEGLGLGLAKPAIERMASQGIIKGVSKDHFDPHGYVTRPEMAVMLVRMMKYSVLSDELPYQDVEADAWYYGAIQAIFQNGIMTGYSQDEFGTGELTWQVPFQSNFDISLIPVFPFVLFSQSL